MSYAIAGLLVFIALCIYLDKSVFMAAYRFRDFPLWEIGFAFQPLRWGFSALISFYPADRGIALYVGPFYLYALLGARGQ